METKISNLYYNNNNHIVIKSEPTTVKSIFVQELLKFLLADIHWTREGNNAQYNCANLVKFLLDRIEHHIGLKPCELYKVSVDAITKEQAQFSAYRVIKQELDDVEPKIHTNNLVAVRLPDDNALNNRLPPTTHYPITPDIDPITGNLINVIDLQRMVYNLDDSTVNMMKVLDVDNLNNCLINDIAEDEQLTYGFVYLFHDYSVKDQNENKNQDSHVLTYIGTPNGVYFLDAQLYNGNTKEGNPLFSNLNDAYPIKGSDYAKNSSTVFQRTCFYLQVGSVKRPNLTNRLKPIKYTDSFIQPRHPTVIDSNTTIQQVSMISSFSITLKGNLSTKIMAAIPKTCKHVIIESDLQAFENNIKSTYTLMALPQSVRIVELSSHSSWQFKDVKPLFESLKDKLHIHYLILPNLYDFHNSHLNNIVTNIPSCITHLGIKGGLTGTAIANLQNKIDDNPLNIKLVSLSILCNPEKIDSLRQTFYDLEKHNVEQIDTIALMPEIDIEIIKFIPETIKKIVLGGESFKKIEAIFKIIALKKHITSIEFENAVHNQVIAAIPEQISFIILPGETTIEMMKGFELKTIKRLGFSSAVDGMIMQAIPASVMSVSLPDDTTDEMLLNIPSSIQEIESCRKVISRFKSLYEDNYSMIERKLGTGLYMVSFQLKPAEKNKRRLEDLTIIQGKNERIEKLEAEIKSLEKKLKAADDPELLSNNLWSELYMLESVSPLISSQSIFQPLDPEAQKVCVDVNKCVPQRGIP